MIRVTRVNGSKFYLNAELIQKVEGTADTLITLLSGERVVVKESPEDIVERVIEYKQIIHNPNYFPKVGA